MGPLWSDNTEAVRVTHPAAAGAALPPGRRSRYSSRLRKTKSSSPRSSSCSLPLSLSLSLSLSRSLSLYVCMSLSLSVALSSPSLPPSLYRSFSLSLRAVLSFFLSLSFSGREGGGRRRRARRPRPGPVTTASKPLAWRIRVIRYLIQVDPGHRSGGSGPHPSVSETRTWEGWMGGTGVVGGVWVAQMGPPRAGATHTLGVSGE